MIVKPNMSTATIKKIGSNGEVGFRVGGLSITPEVAAVTHLSLTLRSFGLADSPLAVKTTTSSTGHHTRKQQKTNNIFDWNLTCWLNNDEIDHRSTIIDSPSNGCCTRA